MVELSTANVLHPHQVAELGEQRKQLQAVLSAPPHIAGQLFEGGNLIRKQMRANDALLKQAPVPFGKDEVDDAVRTEKELREGWLDGMPTQAEMRRNPPDAVSKNLAWDKSKKTKVLQWKNLMRRLHATGISKYGQVDEGDVSNIEMYRPVGGSGEMNMDNAQIPGTQYHLPPPEAGPVVVLSEAEIARVKAIDPDIMLAALDNDDRAKVKAFIADLQTAEPEAPKKGGWTDERRAAASKDAKARFAAQKLEE